MEFKKHLIPTLFFHSFHLFLTLWWDSVLCWNRMVAQWINKGKVSKVVQLDVFVVGGWGVHIKHYSLLHINMTLIWHFSIPSCLNKKHINHSSKPNITHLITHSFSHETMINGFPEIGPGTNGKSQTNAWRVKRTAMLRHQKYRRDLRIDLKQDVIKPTF